MGKGQTLSEEQFYSCFTDSFSLLGLLRIYGRRGILERKVIYVYEESFSFLFRQVGMGWRKKWIFFESFFVWVGPYRLCEESYQWPQLHRKAFQGLYPCGGNIERRQRWGETVASRTQSFMGRRLSAVWWMWRSNLSCRGVLYGKALFSMDLG